MGAVFVLFAAISAIGYHELRALVQADTWVNQSAQLQTAIHRMLQAVVDAETGVRGYLLTDNPTYLDPYHRGEAEYDAVLSQVEAGIGDHAEQRERLHRLEERVREKRAHMARTLAAFARGGFDAGRANVRTGEGKRLMDAIRSVSAEMIAHEQADLESRILHEQQTRAGLALAFAAACVALLGVLGLAYVMGRRELRTRLDAAERLQRLYDASPAMLVSIGLDGLTLAASDAWLARTGYARGDVEGRPWTDWIATRSRPRAVNVLFPALLRDGRCRDVELEVTLADGGTMRVQFSAVLEYDAPVRPARALAVMEDITARTRAQEMLRASERLIDRAGRPARVGGWQFDIEAQKIYWSDQACRIHGVEPGYVPTLREAFEFFTVESRVVIERAVDGCLRAGEPYDVEVDMITRRGQPVRVRIVGEAECADGRPFRLHGAIQDVTEQHRQEQRIAAALAEKETLLKEVYHRVKNNLQVVSSLLRMQMRRLPDGHAREALREAADRVVSMALVHEMLYQVDNYASISLADYTRELCQRVGRGASIGRRGITLGVDAEPLHASLQRAVPIGLVLNEALANSLEHAFPDERSGHVDVRLYRSQDGRAVLVVADDGIGLDCARVEGLGLELIRALATQLGGELSIDRQGGTRVTLVFPLDGEVSPNSPA